MENKIKLFEDRRIRYAWDAEKEEWFFSISDVVEALTDSADPKQYIKKMRARDESLNSKRPTKKQFLAGFFIYEVIGCLYQAAQTIFRTRALPCARPLPSLTSFNSGPSPYARGIEEERNYAILTNEMTKAWSGLSVRDYKQLKGLKKENLRDNMTNVELVLNMLAEVTTTAISKSRKPETFVESKAIAKEGGDVARDARLNIEKRTGNKVISPANAKDKLQLDVKSE